ncbi:unnamed protein product [Blepharisma stoltei]|uniref:Histidine kinase n=1 Tax=Blepharisma stoltei TaxID=1481888 RepID=A0AAU9KJE8_9CILI|nr:unnamed protein product [Blepharisma stoltei]
MEYSQGKKYSGLTNSNRLIDDINLIPSLHLYQEIVFGICKVGPSNLEWRGQKVLWEDQESILLTVRDANQIIQLEQTVSDNKLKNVLLRSVSHELRTPINAIVALVDSLKEEIEIVSNEDFKEKLDIISVSSQLLLSLVNDLLDYSRILAGVFSIQKSKFSFRNLIGSAIQLVKIQAEKKGLKLITRIDKDLPAYVFTDPLRLNQVLLNLLGNALKFTLKGYIEICCLLASKNKVKIIVTDTGIGIEESKMSNLFQEFNTNHNRNLNPSGCGLGLFISNVIVQELGSKPIEVESKLHEGSSFSFIINISEENFNFDDLESVFTDESILESTSPIWVKDFTELLEKEFPQVLIVDDNDFNRFALGTLLNNNDILFSEACTGRQAIKCVKEADERSKPYKLIIMDGSMPELDGWEATKLIFEMYYRGEIHSFPIIVGYTAFSSDLEISKCIESGMKECIIKPCKAEILIQKIAKYLFM